MRSVLHLIAAMVVVLYASRLFEAKAAEDNNSSAPSFEYIGTFGGRINAVRKIGAFTYIGQGCILRVFWNDSFKPRSKEITSIRMDDTIKYIDNYKSALFILTGGTSKYDIDIKVIDINDPAKATGLRDNPFFINPGGRFFIYGNKLLVLDRTEVTGAFDITNPLKPEKIALTDDGKLPFEYKVVIRPNDEFKGDLVSLLISDIRINNKMAYSIEHESGRCNIIDISSPETPRLLSRFKIGAKAVAFDLTDKYLAIADEKNRVDIYDNLTAKKPTALKSIDIEDKIRELQIQDQYLSVLVEGYDEETQSVNVYDIASSSTQIVATSDAQTPYDQHFGVGYGKLLKYRILNSKYWVDAKRNDDNTNSLRVNSTSGRLAPTAMVKYDSESDNDHFTGAMVFGNRIFLSRWFFNSSNSITSIGMFALEDGALKQNAAMDIAEGGVGNLFIQGDYLYLACDEGGLVIYKINN